MTHSIRWIVFLLISGVIFSAWAWAQDERPIEFIDDATWVYVSHESGTEYLIRTQSIVGFVHPLPGDPQQRNGILLTGGKYLTTTIELEEFRQLIERQPEATIIEMSDD